jgi:hypothetical protein
MPHHSSHQYRIPVALLLSLTMIGLYAVAIAMGQNPLQFGLK